MSHRHTVILVQWLTLLYYFLSVRGSSHYCTRQRLFNSTSVESYQASKLVRTEYSCTNHLICSKLKMVTYTAYRTTQRTHLKTIYHCCSGWGGTLCDTEINGTEGVYGIESNAVELEVPAQAFDQVSPSDSRPSEGAQGTVRVVFPLCLFVLVVALLVVVIYSKKRWNLMKLKRVEREEHSIAFSAAPRHHIDSPLSHETSGSQSMLLPAHKDGLLNEEECDLRRP